MRFSSIFLAFAALCMFVTSADASVLGQLLHFDGSLQLAVDNSNGIFRNTDADPVPDITQGIIYFDSVGPDEGTQLNPFTATGSSLFAIFAFDLGLTAAGPPSVFAGTASTGATTSVEALLKKGALDGADFSQLNPTANGGLTPAIAIVSTPGDFTQTAWRNVGGAGTASLEFTTDGGTTWSSDMSIFTVEMTLGLVGDDNHTIRIDDGTLPEGAFRGVYSVAEHVFSSGLPYKQLTGLSSGVFPGGVGDVIIDDGAITPATSGAIGRGWNYNDRGQYQIAPLPEPTSVIAWGVFAVCASLAGLRRTR